MLRRHSTLAQAAYLDLVASLKDEAVAELRGTPTRVARNGPARSANGGNRRSACGPGLVELIASRSAESAEGEPDPVDRFADFMHRAGVKTELMGRDDCRSDRACVPCRRQSQLRPPPLPGRQLLRSLA